MYCNFPSPSTATPGVPDGTIPEDLLKPFNWRCIGPANMGGRVTALAVNEVDPMMYWVGLGGGGLLKTVNNGTTFEIQFDKETTASIGDVAVAASDPKIVWVGTGENNPRTSVSYGNGVYKSLDGGSTWTAITNGLRTDVGVWALAVDPNTPSTVYAGTWRAGAYKSTDGGSTWNTINNGMPSLSVNAFAIDPVTSSTVYAGMNGSGVFKSLDGGATWHAANTGIPASTYVQALAINPVRI